MFFNILFLNSYKLTEKLQEQYRELPASDSQTVNISLHFLCYQQSFSEPVESNL